MTSAWRPGDRKPDRASMLRVNQAGEYGAARIYAGQLAVLGRSSPAAHQIARMAAQEQRHLDRFDQLMTERGVRPTALQ
ncbi:MAG TPA: demethoxyubiquinone hydroxylase family protein, partial [Sphingomicrobium sp.]|nr:demethoxyubiquinone hydroxylase family protein [Sphingomicrobium sp.]